MKTILITGVGSGIGKEVAKYFLNNKYQVIGIDVKEYIDFNEIIYFKSDIRDKSELLKIKKYCLDNNITLDGIINVAGIHKMASLVETNFDDIKSLLDINLSGTILVNNIFHCLLKEKGRIVIVTSEVAPFDPMPFNGLYNISKTALDSYAQALRQELNLLNQKVITIRPGSIETPLSNNSLTDTEKLSHETKLYKKQATKFLKITKKFMGKVIKPENVAKLIYKAYNKKNPKLIYRINPNPYLTLLNLLPKRLQCWIIKMILK